MNKKNIVLAIVFIVVGIILLTVVIPNGIPLVGSAGGANQMTPGSFPSFVAWLMIIASVLQIGQSLLSIKNGTDIEEWEERDMKREGKVLLVFALMVVYIFVSKYIGFFLASVAFVSAFLAIMGIRNKWYYIIAIVACLVAFYCFRYLLYVRVPTIGVWIF